MGIEHFLRLRPFLYHLTHRDNVQSILEGGSIESTARLTQRVDHANGEAFLQRRRGENVVINNACLSFIIRDQAQINEGVLRRSLEGGCTYEQFLILLNSKVFLWPTLKDVSAHYGTYVAENPIVLKFRSQDIFDINQPPKFCHLNSGAPRPHQAYRPNAAPRGMNTFRLAENYNLSPSSVREVTFEHICNLPNTYWIASDPSRNFIEHNRIN